VSVATPGSPAGFAPSEGLEPDVVTLVEARRRRERRGWFARDRLLATAAGLLFVPAAIAAGMLLPSHGRHPTAALFVALVAVFAVLCNTWFEVGAGSVVPTQLAFVPMLLLLPPGWVPLCVAGGVILAVAARKRRGFRLGVIPFFLINSWYSLAPAAIVALDRHPGLHAWPLYACALAVQFAADFAIARIYEGGSYSVPLRLQLRMSAWTYAVDIVLACIGLLAAIVSLQYRFAFLLVLPLAFLLAHLARERAARLDHALELSDAYRGTALLLGDVVEADDAYTGSHSRDVVELCLAVADELGVDARTRRDVEFASLLHDVGKIRIPKEIINKPGALTPEERAIINTHTIAGQLMLEKVGGVLGEIGKIVRSHHERWDGKGYPDRISGEAIPLVARIIGVCDSYNAMTTDRAYRRALSVDAAVEELVRNAGAQFDPQVVEALIRALVASGAFSLELPAAAA
jgi:putative nucleotidyltransferase with HDIG domain